MNEMNQYDMVQLLVEKEISKLNYPLFENYRLSKIKNEQSTP